MPSPLSNCKNNPTQAMPFHMGSFVSALPIRGLRSSDSAGPEPPEIQINESDEENMEAFEVSRFLRYQFSYISNRPKYLRPSLCLILRLIYPPETLPALQVPSPLAHLRQSSPPMQRRLYLPPRCRPSSRLCSSSHRARDQHHRMGANLAICSLGRALGSESLSRLPRRR
jgi:hypothetical protein